MGPSRISIIIILLLCICGIGGVIGSPLAMYEWAAIPGHDLVKKPLIEGLSGLKGTVSNYGTPAKIATTGSESELKARYPVKLRNSSISGWKYPAPGSRPWLGSEVLTLSLRGTKIIQETGTVRLIDGEGGTFGIIAEDGTHYLPSSLPAKYKKDGVNVEFKAYLMPINPAYRMWGSPIRIISITEDSTKKATIETTGTVTWVALEGGFYGIIADDGTQYDPLNLPEKYLQDGLRIRFSAVEEPDVAGFHMWGTYITITGVTPVIQGETSNGDDIVDYKRTGGLAGFNDHLTIYANGTTFVTTKNRENQYVLPSKEMNDLIALFETSGFNSLNQADLAMYKVSGNDFFMYSIEFRGHKIEAIEYAFPESVIPVIERLNNLVLLGLDS
ncbi:MAG: hypothetical protein WCP36_06310 [Methanomicrobiales archaeon]